MEERSFIIVYGPNLVDVSYLHLCAASSKIAEVRVIFLLIIYTLLHTRVKPQAQSDQISEAYFRRVYLPQGGDSLMKGTVMLVGNF